ncbi:hypothetical protein F5Y17DRAFT_382723 [Xylariaceae sp. FL0594]|nr:hypothetical protein F5Y17DRAFT_382723 [Xylariaceae sp. FL0594]
MFREYITALLTHRNGYTGLTYAEDPTIFAFETGNAVQAPSCSSSLREWTRSIAQHIKALAPSKLVMDGTLGIATSHLSIPEVDIYSDHFCYRPDPYHLHVARLKRNIRRARREGKVFFAGAWDWKGGKAGEKICGNSSGPWRPDKRSLGVRSGVFSGGMGKMVRPLSTTTTASRYTTTTRQTRNTRTAGSGLSASTSSP